MLIFGNTKDHHNNQDYHDHHDHHDHDHHEHDHHDHHGHHDHLHTGWSDTEGASDQHTFKDLLRHLQKEQLTCIKVTAMIVIMMIIVGRAF